MISNPESSERPRSPLFQQCGVHEPSDMRPFKRRRVIPEAWDISQSGVPAEGAFCNSDGCSSGSHDTEHDECPQSSSCDDLTSVSSSCGSSRAPEQHKSEQEEEEDGDGPPTSNGLDLLTSEPEKEELDLSTHSGVDDQPEPSQEAEENGDDGNVAGETMHCDPGGSNSDHLLSEQGVEMHHTSEEGIEKPLASDQGIETPHTSDREAETPLTSKLGVGKPLATKKGVEASHMSENSNENCSPVRVEPSCSNSIKVGTSCSEDLKAEPTCSDTIKVEPSCSDISEENELEGYSLVPVKEENDLNSSDSVDAESYSEDQDNGGMANITSTSQNGFENKSKDDDSNSASISACSSDNCVATSDNDADTKLNETEELRAEHSEESFDVINVTEVEDSEINVSSTTLDSEPMIASRPAEHEVVDVESYQPCVVDLTCEEEDEVDVVEVVEGPIVFVGSERRRRRRRRHHHHHDNQVEVIDSVIAEEPDEALDDDSNNNIAMEDIDDNMWGILNPPEIDLQNPNLTFGSLLEQEQQEHVETVDDNSRSQSPQSPPAVPRRVLRERRGARRRQRSRSPSLFPDLTFDDMLPGIANLPAIANGPVQEGADWFGAHAPVALPLGANPMVVEEAFPVADRVGPYKPPASPPPVEQPTITCLVCLDSITTINRSSRTLCSTTCGHVFCSACIEEVVKQRKQCPVCRKKLTKKQYHPLFI